MAVLLDTSVLIEAERHRTLPEDALAGEEQIAISAVTVIEYRRGVIRAAGARRRRRAEILAGILERTTLLDVDRDVAVRAAETWVELERRGEAISSFDLLIASTALAHDLPLAILDVAHFPRVRGLSLLNVTFE
jgi:predicted nucleic acid-binding protein